MTDEYLKVYKDVLTRQVQARDEIANVMEKHHGSRVELPAGASGYGYVCTRSHTGAPVDHLTLLAIAEKYEVTIEADRAPTTQPRYRYCIYVHPDKPVGVSYVESN